MYEQELHYLGLSEKEARVYAASLELGPDTAQNLAKKAGIVRATTYVQIESLKEKGLMSEFEKGKKTLYLAEPPERLESLLRASEKELELKREEVKRILPALLAIGAGAKERPKVRFFEGTEGIRAVNEDFLKAKEKRIVGFVNLDEMVKIFPEQDAAYSRERVRRGIWSKSIYTRAGGPVEGASDTAKLREARYLAPDTFPIKADVTVYDDKVALIAYRQKPIAVIIESSEIADTLRSMHALIWASLPPEA